MSKKEFIKKMAAFSVELNKTSDGFAAVVIAGEMEKLYDDHFHDLFYVTKRIKEAIHAVLHMTYAAGNGGFVADFGLITFNTLVESTDFDKDTRRAVTGEAYNAKN